MQNDRGVPGEHRDHQPYGGTGTGDAGTDPKLFVATTLAALVLAGSAYIWKSGTIPMLKSRTGEIFRKENGNSIGDQSMPVDAGPSRSTSSSFHKDNNNNNVDAGDSRTSRPVGQASPKKRRASQVKQQQHEREAAADNRHDAEDSTAVVGSLGRASRPKERRRRGKDPTKELVKSGKLSTTKISNNTTSKPKSPSPSSSRGQDTTTPRLQRRSTTRSRSPSRTLRDPMSASLQRSSRSRSRSRLGGASSGHEEDPVFSFDALTTTANRDGTASTSSASSTAATDATTFSTTSTAPSSTGDHLDRPRSDSDGTPKPESSTTARRRASSTRGSAKNDDDDPSWDWDGAGGGQFNNNTSPASKSTSTDVPTRFQPSRGTPGTGQKVSSSEVQSANLSPPNFASIVSPEDKTSLSASALSSSSSVQGIPKSTTSPRTDEQEDEVSFPTLNNPRPSAGSSSSLISPAPAPGRNSVSPSVSRPQSRASSSSTTSSSKSKPKNSRAISGLTSLSNRQQQQQQSSGTTSMPSTSQRRVPTPLDASIGGRPGTPSSSSLSSSTHPPPSPSSPYHHHSPSASTSSSGNTNNVAVSAQTQLASLRGALEAARLREEKSRSELDKATRDADALRWENAVSRRREAELQTQLQQAMLQMQGYATYIAAMNQQAQVVQGQGQGQPNFHLQLPPVSHQPAISPPAPAEIVTVEDGDDEGAQQTIEEKVESSSRPEEDRQADGENAARGSNNEPLPSSGEGTSIERNDDTHAEEPISTHSPNAIADTAAPSPTPPFPPIRPPTTTPQTILPFAPQPLHGTFPGTAIPMALHSPFLLPHHPGTPNPQSPLVSSGPHSPFAFPPPHHHPLGQQQQQQPHPHYPFMTLGLSGGPGHMQPLQSPILHPHPGGNPGMMMMSPHLGGGFNGLPPPSPFAGPGSPTTSSFRPMTPATHGAIPSNMGIGMANGGGLQHHASPLWMNGFMSSSSNANGGAAGPASSSALSMSPKSGPSSPLPPYLQGERGRKGWQSVQTRSRPSSMVGGLKGEGELDELESIPQGGSGRGDVDDNVLRDEDDDEGGGLNPLLADAILKRPSSIRMNSKRSTSNFARDGLVGSVSMPGMANGGGARPTASPSLPHGFGNEEANHQEQQPSPQERHGQDEVVEEFTFPSLSELGNVAREKRVGTPALANAEKTSSSRPRSALAMSSLVAGEGSAKTTSEEEHHIP
ncbi:hypothetical protein BKA70DRAFT_1403455 [Coprinopsis sp. MPI-PUGE-AT-0042]|nr:hypothetical protein BKA70DRAFT_1403455 [Coprinopsis sp. MPI-PUGE-AT-0042]